MRVKRPPELAGSHIKLREILRHAGEESFREKGHFPDILLFLSLHAPKRQAMHVDKAINTLKVTCSDSVVSVCEEGEPMFAHGRDGLELLNPGRFDELVFERERLFKFNGAVLAVWGEIIQDGGLFGTSIGFVEMSKEDSRQIKTPADLLSLRVEGGLDEPTGTGADRGPPGSARKAPLGLALDKES